MTETKAEKARSWGGHSRADLRERWSRDDIYLYGSVGSTNDVARRLAEEDDAPTGSIVLAGEQVEGRGRQGRPWHSPKDAGVYLSMVFRPAAVPNPELLPLLAGIGIVRELDGDFPELDPALKWPNDVMVGDRKLGGVLTEAVWGDRGIRFLVVGVGLNVRPLSEDVDEEIREGATSLDAETGEEVPLAEVADAVIRGLEAFVPDPPERLDTPTLDLVDRHDWLQDRRVVVTLPDEEEPLPGVCVGIAPDGRLLFRPDRGALRRLDRGTVEAEP